MEVWEGGAHLSQGAQWPLPGVSWLHVECSRGNGWGQLKEAPPWAGAPSSCGRRKGSVSYPAVWPRQPGRPPLAEISFISRACGHLSHRFFLLLFNRPCSSF